MEDPQTPPTENVELPEAGNDSTDPLRPEIQEGNSIPVPPLGEPSLDMEATEEIQDKDSDDVDDAEDPGAESDNESAISELDEAQFEDFDPNAIDIEERPAIAVDEDNVRLIGKHKRKRTEGDAEGAERKKKKEGRRDKPKKNRKRRDEDDHFSGGEELEGKRSRKRKGDSSRRERKAREPTPDESEEHLSPEERRRRALERAMDDALKNPNRRRGRKDGIDLEAQADAEIDDMRTRMTNAAKEDNAARERGEVARYKLAMLPDVVNLLNRNQLRTNLVDPDTNLMQAVRFFLEPLNDGSLPAYNIQKEIFAALAKLPISKDTLVASGLGKVTIFYTKSQRPEPGIKRLAEKLLAEWSRPILKRSDDYRKKEFKEVAYDPMHLPVRTQPASSQMTAAARARQEATLPPGMQNRARMMAGPTSYSVVPKSRVDPSQLPPVRSGGGSSMIKKITQKNRR